MSNKLSKYLSKTTKVKIIISYTVECTTYDNVPTKGLYEY